MLFIRQLKRPRSLLGEWGLGEGDDLDLSGRSIGPKRATRNAQQVQDELKRAIAIAVLDQFPLEQVRKKSRANLLRWKKGGVWGGAYEEWLRLVDQGEDGELYAAMIGRDDNANRLRQSLPLTDSDEFRAFHSLRYGIQDRWRALESLELAHAFDERRVGVLYHQLDYEEVHSADGVRWSRGVLLAEEVSATQTMSYGLSQEGMSRPSWRPRRCS